VFVSISLTLLTALWRRLDLYFWVAAMRDELVIEEMAVRAIQERMDEAFRAAMQRAIDTGDERTSSTVSKKPGTKNPKTVLAL
jgi:hypothetical protein